MAARRGTSTNSNSQNDNGWDGPDNPPNSRLFVVCDRNCKESEFQEAFGRYGEVEYVRLLKDRNTGEQKGIVYVKFVKTSQAAEALENLNGVTLEDHTRPLKVMVASNRAEGSKRESNETERLLRLFIVVTKDMTEEKLRNHFGEFGEVADVLVVKDKKTGDNKGFAYIRYTRASHAARAFEECEKSYRPVFAEPKNSVLNSRERDWGRNDRFNDNHSGRPPIWSRNSRSQFPLSSHGRMDVDTPLIRPLLSSEGNGSGSESLFNLHVVATAGVTQLQLWKLFDLVPGLESCDLHMRNCDYDDDPVYATVKYRSAQSASFAVDKLNNFEYPPGYPISVGVPDNSDYNRGNGNFPSRSAPFPAGVGEIEKLTNALAHAQSIIKAAGLSSPHFEKRDLMDDFICSVRLPSPQPVAPQGATAVQRLFIVCTPTVLPKYILRDVFGRFEGLIEIYMLTGKTCGYVKYATEESAERAMKLLHGQEVAGIWLKVMLADPRNNESGGGHNKRQKTVE